MKKLTALITVLIMILTCFCACGDTNETKTDKLSIVATTFPQYDWVKQILGEKAQDVELTLLLDDGVDLHSYQPTVTDLVTVSACDMFIYVGGESDSWVEDALKNATNENMTVINLIELLGEDVLEEETVEGMQDEEHSHEEGEEHSHEEENDEHIWLSLKNAVRACEYITEKLSEIDADNASVYEANADKYIEKLNELHKEYENTVNEAKHKTIVVADRFPFRYLVDEYNLNYYAAFSGCSTETQASFETVIFLSDKLEENKLGAVIITESSDGSVADTVISNTTDKNQKVLSLNSMQSVTAKDVENNATYLGIMQENLNVLKEALN